MLGIPFYVEYMMEDRFIMLIGVSQDDVVDLNEHSRFAHSLENMSVYGHYAFHNLVPDNKRYFCIDRGEEYYVPVSEYRDSDPSIIKLFSMVEMLVNDVSVGDPIINDLLDLIDFNNANYVIDFDNDNAMETLTSFSGCGMLDVINDTSVINTFIKKQKLTNLDLFVRNFDGELVYGISHNLAIIHQRKSNVH